MKSCSLFATIALLCTATTNAQIKHQHTKPAPKNTATQPASLQPKEPPSHLLEASPSPAVPFEPAFFVPGQSVIAYRENDPRKVFSWVEARIAAIPGKPDQFSNSAEREKYEMNVTQQMRSLGSIPIFGSCQKSYDANRELFEVKVLLSSIKDSSLRSPDPEALNLRKLTVARLNVHNDTYTAQNAYGATIEVSRTTSDDYVLTFPAGHLYEPTSVLSVGNTTSSVSLPYRHTFHFLSLTAKLPPAEARTNDKQIVCMYVFSLEPPYAYRFTERNTPTRDLPYDRTSNAFALFGRLDQVAVVHRDTGVIYDNASRSK